MSKLKIIKLLFETNLLALLLLLLTACSKNLLENIVEIQHAESIGAANLSSGNRSPKEIWLGSSLDEQQLENANSSGDAGNPASEPLKFGLAKENSSTNLDKQKIPLRGTYDIALDKSDLVLGLNGYQGRIHLEGKIVPQLANYTKEEKNDPRNIAKSLLEQESELFGIAEQKIFKLKSMGTSVWDDTTTLVYERKGKDPQSVSKIMFRIKNNDFIESVTGILVD